MGDQRDDFSVLDAYRHMFFGLSDPPAQLREFVEQSLREQVPGTETLALRAVQTPLFLTAGLRLENEPSKVVVTRFGSVVHIEATLRTPAEREPQRLEVAVTMLFANVHLRGGERSRFYLDVGGDVHDALNEAHFARRFAEHGLEVAEAS